MFSSHPSSTSSTLSTRSTYPLQIIIFTRHLQRVLDALPAGTQLRRLHHPHRQQQGTKVQRHRVFVCPRLSRSDTIAPYSRTGSIHIRHHSSFHSNTYNSSGIRSPSHSPPSPTFAMQSMLHVLFSQHLSRPMPAKAPMLQKNGSTASVQLLTCRYRVLRQQTLPTRRAPTWCMRRVRHIWN